MALRRGFAAQDNRCPAGTATPALAATALAAGRSAGLAVWLLAGLPGVSESRGCLPICRSTCRSRPLTPRTPRAVHGKDGKVPDVRPRSECRCRRLQGASAEIRSGGKLSQKKCAAACAVWELDRTWQQLSIDRTWAVVGQLGVQSDQDRDYFQRAA